MFPADSRPANSAVLQDLARFGPARCDRLGPADAAAYTARVARTAGENFHVLSRLVPREMRADVANVYAYCRWADDLADEVPGPARASALLAWWRDELRRCFDGRPRHPVFVALRETVARRDLPPEPFDHLIDAFEQDQRQTRYDTWDEVLGYCRRSADPVGRLYLMICGYRDAARFALSDQTCTALQLVNFWQDVRRDLLDRDRVYIPREVAKAHGLDLDNLRAVVDGRDQRGQRGQRGPDDADAGSDAAYRATIRDLADRTRSRFEQGRSLLPLVRDDVRPAIHLFTLGGEAVLRKIVRAGYATHRRRPRVGRFGKAALFARAWLSGMARSSPVIEKEQP